jgi:6-phosphogluconolactonase
MASTFVYVSNAEDGDIGVYALATGGSLQSLGRVPAGKPVGPLALTPDRRFSHAAVRSKPFTLHSYAIDARSGALREIGRAPLAESLAYISTDRTGRYLFGASYGGHLVSVSPLGPDGRAGAPQQVIATARNAHAIVADNSNRFVYVPHLGSDQVFQFLFDERSGRLSSNTPPLIQMGQGTGPRHIRISADNRFAYLLDELTATVTTFGIDPVSGLLAQLGSASSLPPDTTLGPGLPRGPLNTPGAVPRDTSRDIWASDLHLTPDGRFLFAAERTGSTLGAFSVDRSTGALAYLGSTPTEKQPRGFAIDPSGRYLIVSGEKSETLSVYAIGADGGLELLGKSPTGRGRTGWKSSLSIDSRREARGRRGEAHAAHFANTVACQTSLDKLVAEEREDAVAQEERARVPVPVDARCAANVVHAVRRLRAQLARCRRA